MCTSGRLHSRVIPNAIKLRHGAEEIDVERISRAVAMEIGADGVRIERMFKGLSGDVPRKTSTAVPDIKQNPVGASSASLRGEEPQHEGR